MKSGADNSIIQSDHGRLWELEGNRKGPIDRGQLKEDEDLLSEAAINQGLGQVIELERMKGGTELRFSCIALAGRNDI